MIAYTFADAAALLALSRRLRYEGVASEVRMPRIVLTIRSSIRVIPLSSRASLLASARSIYTRIVGLAAVGDPRSRDALGRRLVDGGAEGRCVEARRVKECHLARDCACEIGEPMRCAAEVVRRVASGLDVGEAVRPPAGEDGDAHLARHDRGLLHEPCRI